MHGEGIRSPDLKKQVTGCRAMLGRLRQTSMDFENHALVPRAMQCEEDIDRATADYQSHLFATSVEAYRD